MTAISPLDAELSDSKPNLISSLFNCRKDVFAVHWQKGKKSGYMPACRFDPHRYKMHKMKGGTFQQYTDKTYLPLTDEEIKKHLRGEKLIGIYPLLKNNTSFFIAADFDGDNWISESLTFIEICKDNRIPAYLERSRSGNGGHVWIFFEQAYEAVKSRKVMKTLLEESGVFSVFDKQSSFDRLFPNQDYLSGKGLGNLIALPFHKPALLKGNSCFVNPETEPLEAYPDQWAFLSAVERVSVKQLDALYDAIEAVAGTGSGTGATAGSGVSKGTVADRGAAVSKAGQADKLQIILKNNIRINRSGMRIDLVNFLKKELVIANAEYFIKKKSGKSTWNTQQYFKCIEETDAEVIIPKVLQAGCCASANSTTWHLNSWINGSNMHPLSFPVT